jgi:2'-5' RNA ligase
MSNLMRTFIAIPLNPEIHQNLAVFCREHGLNSRDHGFRPVKPENIHLTLKFLGEIDQSQANKISLALAELSSKCNPFSARLKGIGAFPSWKNHPRVIWVGAEPLEPLRLIFQGIDQVLTRLGIASDRKPFSPHLTLARISFVNPGTEQAIRQLQNLPHEPEFGELTVDRINLYRSVLLPGGPVYSILSNHPFSAQ